LSSEAPLKSEISDEVILAAQMPERSGCSLRAAEDLEHALTTKSFSND